MVLGRELIADVEDIENDVLLETIDGIEPLMEKIIEICKLKVVAKCEYQFTPIGVTMLYLLSESHLTIHTYPEKKACSINLYTCNAENRFTRSIECNIQLFQSILDN